MKTLPATLPTVPPGCTWQWADGAEHARLAPVWRELQRCQSGSPFWRPWFQVLLDGESGWFDHHFMQVLELFDSDDELICCAAEVEHFDRPDTSQILFWVPLQWRSRGLGEHALRAALALVRLRGRAFAEAQCRLENRAAAALLRRHGLLLKDGATCPGYGHWVRKMDRGILERILPAQPP